MTTSDDELLARWPHAIVDHDSKFHHRGILARRLLINRCDDCGTWHHPPKAMCPKCWSWRVAATEVSGRGVLHALTRLHQGPAADGVDYASPHTVIIVELEEQRGLRLATGIAGPADGVELGASLVLEWTERAGVPFPSFATASGAARSEP